jgi:hypothetical protein
MDHYTLIGVDPGLVDTGVVAIHLFPLTKSIEVRHRIVKGDVVTEIAEAIDDLSDGQAAYTFVEQYRDRGTVFQQHGRMRELEVRLKSHLIGAKFLDNMGIKTVVARALMKLLHVWDFPTTNHRDLQSAARIAILGALKNPELNDLLTDYVIDHVDGIVWRVL